MEKTPLLKIELIENIQPWRLRFVGEMTNRSTLAQFTFKSETKIEIDLEKLSGLNSSGVQSWISWVEALPAGIEFEFSKCPVVFCTHLGSVAGMLPAKSTLKSFFVPYIEASTSETCLIEFKHDIHFTKREIRMPARVTSEFSGRPLELDTTPQRYFSFLKKFFPSIDLSSAR